MRPDEEGPVLVDQAKCIGCAFCVQACPFGVIRLAHGSGADASDKQMAVIKCDLCADRQAEGLEPSSWAVDHARACGLPMIEGTLESAHLPNAAYAVLTMWDVIEHLGDPLHELREAWQVLRPGGYLAVHTMDRGSLFARVMGRRWPWLMEMHLYYFSTHTLRAILKEAGFEVLAVQPQGRYLRLGYLATRVKPYSRLAAAALDRVAKVLRLRELAVPVNFGDLITAYARKPS